MVGPQQGDQVVGTGRGPGPELGVVDQLEGAEDVVGVLEASVRDRSVEDDLLGLRELESVPSIEFEK